VLHEVSSDQARMLRMLFPHLDGLDFAGVEAGEAGVVIVARSALGRVTCRGCGTLPSRVCDRYPAQAGGPVVRRAAGAGGSGGTQVPLP
jgi:hypothetical protein